MAIKSSGQPLWIFHNKNTAEDGSMPFFKTCIKPQTPICTGLLRFQTAWILNPMTHLERPAVSSQIYEFGHSRTPSDENEPATG